MLLRNRNIAKKTKQTSEILFFFIKISDNHKINSFFY